MAAPSSSSSQGDFQVPEGWVSVSEPNGKGDIVKYYTNILGQRFYSESDLMRNIRDAKKRGLSIYAPDFVPPATGPFAMPSKSNVETASSSDVKQISENNGRREGSTSGNKEQKKSKKRNKVEGPHNGECATASASLDEVPDEDEIECARALLEISGQRNVERRVSRRLSGLQPELQVDVDFHRALEYIIKDKP